MRHHIVLVAAFSFAIPSLVTGEVCYFPGTYGGDQAAALSEKNNRESAWGYMYRQQKAICDPADKVYYSPDDCFLFDGDTGAVKDGIDIAQTKTRLVQGELVVFLAPGENGKVVIGFSEPGFSSDYEGDCSKLQQGIVEESVKAPEDEEKDDLGFQTDDALDMKEDDVVADKTEVAKQGAAKVPGQDAKKEEAVADAGAIFDMASAKPGLNEGSPPAVDRSSGESQKTVSDPPEDYSARSGKAQSLDFSLSPDKRIAAKERAALKNIGVVSAKEKVSARVDRSAKLDTESYAIRADSFLDCLSYAPDVVALSACMAVRFDSLMRH